jgi:hypothetical protein
MNKYLATMDEYLAIEFLGNNLQEYIFFISTILIGLIFKKLLSKYLSHLLYKIIGKKGNSVGIDKFDQLLTKPLEKVEGDNSQDVCSLTKQSAILGMLFSFFSFF